MSHVKIKYLDLELSVDQPDNYAALLEEIKDFDDENLMNAEMDEILITDSKGNELKDNVDYDKYILNDPTNKIIYVSLKKEEEKVFNLCDYGKELDDHFEELKKKKKEEDEKNKNENKDVKYDPENLEEEELNYDPAFDEFNYLSNRKNVYFIKQFWDVFETKMIKKFEEKIDTINNIANKDMLKKMKELSEKFDKQNKEMNEQIKSINETIKNIETEQKREIKYLKTDIETLKNDMINNIKDNMETKFKDIKSNIEIQNQKLEEKFNNIDKNFESEKNNLKEEFGKIEKNFQLNNENIKNQFVNVENNLKHQKDNLIAIYNSIINEIKTKKEELENKITNFDDTYKKNFEQQKKEISQNFNLIKESVEENSPIKITLTSLTKTLDLKEIIDNKAQLKLKLINYSKVPINNYILKQKENKYDIVTFDEKLINIPKDSTIEQIIDLKYTGKKEYYDPPYIQILLTKKDIIIDELFASFDIKIGKQKQSSPL